MTSQVDLRRFSIKILLVIVELSFVKDIEMLFKIYSAITTVLICNTKFPHLGVYSEIRSKVHAYFLNES